MNRSHLRGVLSMNAAPMHEWTDRLAGSVMSAEDEALEREFEARLLESSTLAFRVAYSVLRHREDAEDIAQDAFSRAHRSFRQLRDRDRFRSWLVKMVWRMAIDRRRADRRRSAREIAHAAPDESRGEPDAAQTMMARQRADAIWQAIDQLPEKLRAVIVLANIEEHDLAEVATLLGVPLGTVKSRLFAARQQMKDQLQWLNIDRSR